jgi:tripartite-type tricarboxylate transporter receptor subunit TctC
MHDELRTNVSGVQAMGDCNGRVAFTHVALQFFCTISGSAAAPLQGKLVEGIAVFRHERLPSVRDVPTSFEQGVDFEGSTWFAFFAPKGTPPAIIEKLHDASVAAVETSSVQEQLAANGTYVVAPEKRYSDRAIVNDVNIVVAKRDPEDLEKIRQRRIG